MSDEVQDLIEQLEEWSAVTAMANMLAQQLPAGVSRDIEETAGPVELWRLGATMSTLSLETRAEIMTTLSKVLVILHERLDEEGVSRRRGMLRLAPSASAGGA